MHLSRRKIVEKMKAAIVIQCCFLSYYARRKYQAQKYIAAAIQRRWRVKTRLLRDNFWLRERSNGEVFGMEHLLHRTSAEIHTEAKAICLKTQKDWSDSCKEESFDVNYDLSTIAASILSDDISENKETEPQRITKSANPGSSTLASNADDVEIASAQNEYLSFVQNGFDPSTAACIARNKMLDMTDSCYFSEEYDEMRNEAEIISPKECDDKFNKHINIHDNIFQHYVRDGREKNVEDECKFESPNHTCSEKTSISTQTIHISNSSGTHGCASKLNMIANETVLDSSMDQLVIPITWMSSMIVHKPKE